jgi:hypothetical protein
VLHEGGIVDRSQGNAESAPLKLPEIPFKVERKPRAPNISNFGHVRKNVKIYGRGIFKPPTQFRQTNPPPTYPSHTPTLPPKSVVDGLLTQYCSSVQTFMPILQWSAFEQDVGVVYRQNTLQSSPHVWIALFFAVLACGTLQEVAQGNSSNNVEADGLSYLSVAAGAFQTWIDDFTIDHARTALIISIYLQEAGMRSAASVWLGTASRIIQDLRVQYDAVLSQHTSLARDCEIFLRTWWSIYAWDRYASFSSEAILVTKNLTDYSHSNAIGPSQLMRTNWTCHYPVRWKSNI